jgi:molecular chaperone Hsp33
MQFKNHNNKLLDKADYSLPFILNKVGINGRLVNLNNSITEILTKHKYPNSVSRLLGELIIFVSLLGSNLKSQGIVTAELKVNKGLIKLLVADYTHPGEIRGYGNLSQKLPIADNASFRELVEEGYLVITLDLGENFERYQGIVEIKGDSLAHSFIEYMNSSQQINTALKLVVAEHKKGTQLKWIASGLLIQKLPQNDQHIITNEDWEKFAMYVDTISDEEMILLDITAEDLLHRLFHEDGVWIFESTNIIHKCRCSRARMQNILNSISQEEKQSIIVQQGHIEVSCQFCNHKELFV